jgi:Domain of unknown function (DUF4326)
VSKVERIQLSRTKGWRMPANTVKVDRTTKWGNPFVVGEHGTHAECIAQYRKWIGKQDLDLSPLRGKNLACWCKIGEACHAAVLLEMANK